MLTGEQEKQFIDSVLQVAMSENEDIFGKIKEEGNMCEALRKFFEPELNEAMEKRERDIILNALKAGNSVEDISKVMLVSKEEIESIAKANC